MPEPDEATVRRAQQGDRDAFRVLFDQHRDGVYGFVRQMVGDPDLAADLAQDAFVRAWEALPRLKAPKAFRAWLYRIAVNLVRDHCKRPQYERMSLDATGPEGEEQGMLLRDPAPSPDRVAVRHELSQAVAQAVARLSPERREVVLLHHLQGVEVREIAQLLGVAEGTVKSRLGRARAELRRHLAEWMEE